MSLEGQKFTVSEVIDRLGINKFTWVMFIFLGFAMIFDGYDFMVASQTTSAVATTLQAFLDPSGADTSIATVAINARTGNAGSSLAALGASISSWGLLGMVIGGAIGGIISDKIGRKKTLVIAIIFYGAFTLPQAYATDFWFYAITRLIAGLGVGSCIPVVTTCFSETIPSKNRGVFITFGMAFMVLGWVLAGVAVTTLNSMAASGNVVIPFAWEAISNPITLNGADGSSVTQTQNWRMAYFIGVLPVVYGVLLALFMKETPHWFANSGYSEKAVDRLHSLIKGAGQNLGTLDPALLTVPPKMPSASPKVLFSKKFIVATAAIWTLYFIGQVFVYGLNPWITPMMGDGGFGYSGTDASAMQTFNNVAAICSNVTVGFLSDKFGRKRTLIFSWLFVMLAVVIFALTVGPNNFAYCMFLFFLMGFAMNFAITGVQPLMPESYPTQVRNTGVSWCQAFARFGGAAAPIVFASITPVFNNNWNQIMLLLLAPAAIGLICTIVFVRRETSGKDLDTLVSEAVAE
ncbi:MAG: MFS transporter [Coriobacteriales bacterium]|jgi:MFS family permease|nr:MFS transporter [Coriobacteriales bacterium]